uniref:Gag-pol polyprotein n=1 Tax=Solanum tuberosum TaxID=4113 RepID=M1DP91_SOLTU
MNEAQPTPPTLDYHLAEQVSHAELRAAFPGTISQSNQQVEAPANPNGNTTSSRVRDFTQMNPPEFYGLKVEEDLQEFIEGIQKITQNIGVCPVDNANLATYQLKGWLRFGTVERRE